MGRHTGRADARLTPKRRLVDMMFDDKLLILKNAPSDLATLADELPDSHLLSRDLSPVRRQGTDYPATSCSRKTIVGISSGSMASSSDQTSNASSCTFNTSITRSPASSIAPEIATSEILEGLAARYGRGSNMVILDPSYRTFINKAQTAALSYKVLNGVAVVGGDPLCHPDLYAQLLAEFKAYRSKHNWGISFVGASEGFANYARRQHWKTVHFATERVLDPMNNDILCERAGKRMIVQNKQLLDPAKGGVTLRVYTPATGEDHQLEKKILGIYNSWCEDRNQKSTAQAFITVYRPFDFRNLMTYIYTSAADGTVNGFAALRFMGTTRGYHLDPCIAAVNAPKGISDLLVFAAMAFTNRRGYSYLNLGCEPLESLGEIRGMTPALGRILRSIHNSVFQRLPIRGKRAYHNKFRPDPLQEAKLYLVFSSGGLGLVRQLVAVSHMANISLWKLVKAKAWRTRRETECPGQEAPAEA